MLCHSLFQAQVKDANPGAKADEIVSKDDEVVCTNSPELGLLTIFLILGLLELVIFFQSDKPQSLLERHRAL